MPAVPEYELVDFGHGRKLESLSGYLISRPSPAANFVQPLLVDPWEQVSAVFNAESRHWEFYQPWPRCFLTTPGFRLPLKPTPFGHIGAFPEQQPNWNWLAQSVRQLAARLDADPASRPVHALNLFAHTGGSSFAMAAAGAAVAHVDAAKPNVLAAKQAATESGLENAAIRYLVDDALKFCQREVRRTKRYDLVVLDPPAYGHAPDGKTWRIQRDLWPLLDTILQLYSKRPGAMLITGHSEGVTSAAILDYLLPKLPLNQTGPEPSIQAGRSSLADRSGRKLDTGFYIRVMW